MNSDINIKEIENFLIEELSVNRAKSLKNIDNSKKEELTRLLWEIMISNKHPHSWRAAWSIFHLVEKQKELMRPYLSEIIKLLLSFKYDGQKREMMKVLLLFPTTDLEMGKLVGICFRILDNPNESLAVRVHAMQIIFNISEIELEIKPELKSTIIHHLDNSSKGFKSRGNKLLRKMKNVQI
ncbi:MAG: hypothetical protein DRI86_05885 [Bacteroidetes bacterium]|nr:MAG: hypothetical protein DRI86_05885 [Bacteroidota bacterium]